MIELGKRQTLMIVKEVEFGVYLAEKKDAEERVLLPRKERPKQAGIGDEVEVFIYQDSKDRMIATVREPLISLGETALLTVKETGKYGTFLDWGLEKDLLLPFSEQLYQVRPGEKCLAALYIDKSRRLCTTMKVYPYLRTDSSYQKDDWVEGLIYEVNERFGAYVAVDNRYSALIPAGEPIEKILPGQTIKARVSRVLEDGKLNLSIREKAYIQMNVDAERLLEMIGQAGGRLPFNDKADAQLIRSRTGMSKNEFKRAVGNLYKRRLITIGENEIRKV